MKKNHFFATFLLLCPFVVTLSSCTFLKKLVFTIDNSVILGEPKTMADCTDFIGDVSVDCQAYLKAKEDCENGNYEKVYVPGSMQNTQWAKDFSQACKQKQKDEEEGARKAKFEAVDKGNAAIQSASCDELLDAWNTHYSAITDNYFATEEGSIQNFVAAGRRFAGCKQWDFVFEKLIHWGGPNEHGPQLIEALVADGVDIEAQMLTFLKKNPMDFEYSPTAAQHYTDYLNKNKLFARCKDYITPSKKMPERAWEQFSYFFQESNCKAAANSVKLRLSGERPGIRMMACRTLAKIGNRRHLAKMQAVAKNDPYFKEIEIIRDDKLYLKKEYTVRDVCTESIAELRTR